MFASWDNNPSGAYLYAFKYNTVISFLTFLESKVMLMPPFLMECFSLVAPIVSHFNMILDTLKIFLTAWGTYSPSINLKISPPCSFLFTVPFSAHFILWTFLTVTSILYSLILVIFSSCMLCAMTHCCLPTILQGIPCCHFSIFPTKCSSHKEVVDVIFFLFILWPTINRPVDIFSTVGIFFVESGFPVILVSVSFIFYFPRNLTLCDHILYTCCTHPWITCSCVAFFLYSLVLEPSLIALVSLVYCYADFFFQNPRIYFLRSLYAIFNMLTS